MELKTIANNAIALMRKGLVSLFKKYLRVQLRFDRKVLKRYFGIETPIYKIWHDAQVDKIQSRLDRCHEMWQDHGFDMAI